MSAASPADPTEVNDGPPLHGFRGGPATLLSKPRGLTIALSREAGARGVIVARKVGELLGWQVFDQELLDFLVNDDAARDQLLADVPPGAREWADSQLQRLRAEGRLNVEADTIPMVRLMLTVAARGEAVIVGRGAGFLLPTDSTLHVRIVAPLESRIAYIGETQRLTRTEASIELQSRDDLRAQFIDRTFRRAPTDLYSYDLLLNSTRLGVEACARAIVETIKFKHLEPDTEPDEDDYARM